MNATEFRKRLDLKKLTKAQLKAECLVGYDATCQYCQRRGDFEKGPDGRAWHLDRVWPGVLGGAYEADNVILACSRCNHSKGGKEPFDRPEWDTCLPLAAILFSADCLSFMEPRH